MIKNVTITSDQSLFDVVLQYYGDISKVYDFIQLNPTIPNVMYNSLKGKTVQYEEQSNVTANYFSANSKTISTKYPQFSASPFSEDFIFSVDVNLKVSMNL